jgi:hypothetical protein
MAKMRVRAVPPVVGCLILVFLCGSGAAATELQWKLAKGKTYYQRDVVVQQIIQTVMGQEQKIDQTIGLGYKLQVLDVDAQGNMRIRYTYLWSRLKQVNPMAKIDYDSSKESPVPTGAESFAALIGQSYTVKMTPKGKILDVNGVEQVREAVLKKLSPGAAAAMGMNPVTEYLNSETLRQMTEAAMAIYPDKPVNPGESWSKEITMTVTFKMVIQSKWTLQKEDGGVATIALAATMRTDPNAATVEAEGMKMRFVLSGPQEGTLQVSEATGLITTAKEHSQLKGDMQILSAADAPPTMSIPMTIDTQITGEMSEQMWKTSP